MSKASIKGLGASSSSVPSSSSPVSASRLAFVTGQKCSLSISLMTQGFAAAMDSWSSQSICRAAQGPGIRLEEPGTHQRI